jgi:hypothetical protein
MEIILAFLSGAGIIGFLWRYAYKHTYKDLIMARDFWVKKYYEAESKL